MLTKCLGREDLKHFWGGRDKKYLRTPGLESHNGLQGEIPCCEIELTGGIQYLTHENITNQPVAAKSRRF